jgi:hypothetical protein
MHNNKNQDPKYRLHSFSNPRLQLDSKYLSKRQVIKKNGPAIKVIPSLGQNCQN